MMLAASELHAVDYAVLVGYFAIMLGVGAYFWRYMKGMKDYFSGGNRIPWWLSGVSFYMSGFSAFLFVAYSAVAFNHGFVAVVACSVTGPAVLIGGLLFAGYWRRTRMVSPVEYLEERYGLTLRQTFAWMNVPVRMIDDGLRLVAIGLFVSGGLGMPLEEGIFWSGVIILAYTCMGGLWAVTVTDFLQFVVMAAGVVVLLPLSLGQIGGLRGLIENSPPGFFNWTGGEYTWRYLGGWALIVFCSYNTNFALVQRYYCVATERDARKAAILVAVLYVIGAFVFFVPAMAARQFLPDGNPEMIYAEVCVRLLPAGMLGLIIAAMFSATMSALSSDYNVVASVLTNDVYKRLLNRNASEKTLVLVGRLTTLLIGVIALGVAMAIMKAESSKGLFRQMVTLFSVAMPPIAIPMLLGLVWRRATHIGALVGFLVGIVVGLVMFYRGDVEHAMAATTAVTTLVVMAGVSLAIPAGPAERLRSEAFARKLATPVKHDVVEADAGTGPSPFRVVGVSTVAIAVLLLGITPFVPWGMGAKLNLGIGLFLLLIGALWATRARGPAVGTEAES